MRHTSPTFDEIVLVAGGARGFETGRFDMVPDHPPLLQYVYGLPVYVAGAAIPEVDAGAPDARTQTWYRYAYARSFFFGGQNDPERTAWLGRLPAAIFAAALVLVTFIVTSRHWGSAAGLLAAALVAFLPDVLAHGGIAYMDLPVTIAYLVGVFAIDRAVREPTPRRAAALGLVLGLGLGAKISAAALLPVGALLLTAEAVRSRAETSWLRRVPLALLVAAACAYLTLVLIYRGDLLLDEFRYGLAFRSAHMTQGHGASAFLLGQLSTTGWWYFFPVAFLFKTSAGLHVLMAIAALGAAAAARARARGSPADATAPGGWRTALDSPLRAPVAGILVFGLFLVASRLNIGFRHAMPVLPLICIVTAAGIAAYWPRMSRPVRAVAGAAVAWQALFALSYHPHFLGFVSEYGPGRERNHEVFIDSNLDWGQGLVALRDYMRREGIPRVHLAYFGSGAPEAYGIDYAVLPGAAHIGRAADERPAPDVVVVSATHLWGAYLREDVFAPLRDYRPDAVLANSLLVYDLRER